MALNSIKSYLNYHIKEIEENESIPPPRFSFTGHNKTISSMNYHKKTFYDKYNLNIEAININSKSFCSYFNVYKLYDNFFNENLLTKNESRNRKYFNKRLMKKMQENKENKKISKSITIRTKNNSSIISQEPFDSNINLYKRINNKRIIKKPREKSKKINLNKKPIFDLEKDDDKPKIKINESLTLRKIISERDDMNNINYSSTVFYNNDTNSINNNINNKLNFFNSNLLLKLKNVPYIRKKAKNYKKIKAEKNHNKNSMSQSLSLKNFSIHSEKSIKKGKFIQKRLKNKEKIFDISLFNKIRKKDGILFILRFLDYYDIINIFETKNRKMLLIINKAIVNTYYTKIKKELVQYNSLFEPINFSIVRSKIKEALKIDLIANIRLIMTQEKNNKLEPLYIKLAYEYNFFKKVKFDKELITKEEYEFQSKVKNENICDYYSFDFYPKNLFHNDKNGENNKIYISKELPILGKDCNNIATVQPVLPFSEEDEGIINLEIYNAEKGFVNFEEIKIGIKMYNLKNYLKHLAKKEINNIRISEYEELCTYWKNINLYEYKDLILKMIKTYFGTFFEIKQIYYDNIGIYIFKAQLKAIKSGFIKNKKSVGINIKIVEKKNVIKNEIRKNNLLFEKRDVVEIRNGDEVVYYFCLK